MEEYIHSPPPFFPCRGPARRKIRRHRYGREGEFGATVPSSVFFFFFFRTILIDGGSEDTTFDLETASLLPPPFGGDQIKEGGTLNSPLFLFFFPFAPSTAEVPLSHWRRIGL